MPIPCFRSGRPGLQRPMRDLDDLHVRQQLQRLQTAHLYLGAKGYRRLLVFKAPFYHSKKQSSSYVYVKKTHSDMYRINCSIVTPN